MHIQYPTLSMNMPLTIKCQRCLLPNNCVNSSEVACSLYSLLHSIYMYLHSVTCVCIVCWVTWTLCGGWMCVHIGECYLVRLMFLPSFAH